MSRYLIGVDAGGTYIKATLFDEEGHAVRTSKQLNSTVLLGSGRCERDPNLMMEAVYATIGALASDTHVEPRAIAGVAVTGLGCGLWLLDQHMEPIHNGIISTDTRATSLIGQLSTELRETVEARVGSRMFGGLTLPLMLWMSRHDPDLVARTAQVVSCKDLIRGQLTGDYSTDSSDAGFTGLCDLRADEWALDVLDLLGIPEWKAKLPVIGAGVDVAGTITSEASARCGIPAGTPVVRGVLDVTACAVASGVVDTHSLLVIAGTFGNNQTLHFGTPRASTAPLAQAGYVLPDSFLATEGGPTSAGNLEWFLRNIVGEGSGPLDGPSMYDRCNEWVSAAYQQDRRSDALFLPYLYDGPGGAPAALVGMSASETATDLALPVYEGIAFAHRRNVETLLSGEDAATPATVRLSGGGSNSQIWPQIFADTLDLPVEITDCAEMGALGSAIVAAVGVGLYPDVRTAMAAMVRVERSYQPDASRTAAATTRYQRHHQITDLLAQAPADAARPANQTLGLSTVGGHS